MNHSYYINTQLPCTHRLTTCCSLDFDRSFPLVFCVLILQSPARVQLIRTGIYDRAIFTGMLIYVRAIDHSCSGSLKSLVSIQTHSALRVAALV